MALSHQGDTAVKHSSRPTMAAIPQRAPKQPPTHLVEPDSLHHLCQSTPVEQPQHLLGDQRLKVTGGEGWGGGEGVCVCVWGGGGVVKGVND